MGFSLRHPLQGAAFDARSRIAAAGAVYVLWVALTWFLEKRVGLLVRYDPLGRTLYALLANVAVGTVLAARAVRWSAPRPARPIALAITVVAGTLLVAKAASPAATQPVALVNAFAQILPTSIAEVVTCWLLVGGAVRDVAMRVGRVPATIIAIVVADVAFAAYHVAHSAPFDRPAMMAFLALPGLLTGVLVFVARDRVAAILAQNLFAMIGVTKNVDTEVFRHPFVWAYAVALVAVAAAFLALRLNPRTARCCT